MTSPGKKAARRKARRQAARAKRRQKRALLWSGVAIAVAVAVGLASFQPLPEALAGVERFTDLGGGHLAPGERLPAYNSDPPTSGKHSPVSAPCGIYTSDISDEVQIHNLEHGTVIIQYRPDLNRESVRALQDYARTKTSHILLAPRAGLSDPVVLTSWTRRLRLDSADIATIELYYDQFAFTGPEVGVPCAVDVDETA